MNSLRKTNLKKYYLSQIFSLLREIRLLIRVTKNKQISFSPKELLAASLIKIDEDKCCLLDF